MKTITLELPETLYQSAAQVAQTTQRPLADIIRESLTHTLPPLDDVPVEEAALLASLSTLNDGALWQVARAVFTPSQQHTMHRLLDGQSKGTLTAAEEGELAELMDEYGRVLVRKAHAWLLLARRGYQVPPQS